MTDGGEIPVDLAHPNGLATFKTIVSRIRESLKDQNGSSTSAILLKQMENAKDVDTLTRDHLFAWKDSEEPAIVDYAMAFSAVENMLRRIDGEQRKHLDIERNFLQIENTTMKGVIDVKIVNLSTSETLEKPADNEPVKDEEQHNGNDISEATEAVISDEIKTAVSDAYQSVAKERAEIEAISDKPEELNSPTLDEKDSDWTKPKRVSKLQPVEKEDTVEKSQSENVYGSLFVEDDPDNEDEFDEFEGSRGMEQSFDDEVDLDASPDKPSKKKSEVNELLER